MAYSALGTIVWTAREVEAETEAGYFHSMQWQGDNAKLNAWLAEIRKREAENRAWWERYRAEKAAAEALADDPASVKVDTSLVAAPAAGGGSQP